MENDLEKMSKTIPYIVPEGFFDEMEKHLKQEVAPKKPKPKARKVVLWTSLAVAASLALLLVLRQGWHHSDDASFEQVEMAFNQLSDNDQQLMLELFDEMDELDYY
ncbi:MAG: hypothetical protein K6G25_11485 [Bacteroidales bacterium]|nr:hypothetical protein [Bacteroidales bacterium]